MTIQSDFIKRHQTARMYRGSYNNTPQQPPRPQQYYTTPPQQASQQAPLPVLPPQQQPYFLSETNSRPELSSNRSTQPLFVGERTAQQHYPHHPVAYPTRHSDDVAADEATLVSLLTSVLSADAADRFRANVQRSAQQQQQQQPIGAHSHSYVQPMSPPPLQPPPPPPQALMQPIPQRSLPPVYNSSQTFDFNAFVRSVAPTAPSFPQAMPPPIVKSATASPVRPHMAQSVSTPSIVAISASPHSYAHSMSSNELSQLARAFSPPTTAPPAATTPLNFLSRFAAGPPTPETVGFNSSRALTRRERAAQSKANTMTVKRSAVVK